MLARVGIGMRPVLVVGLVAATLFTVFPFYWLVVSSVKDASQLFTVNILPVSFSWGSYQDLFAHSPMVVYVVNSIIIALSVTLITLVSAVLGTYSLVFFRYRGREWFGRLILLTYMFPGVVIVLPMFSILSTLGLANNIVGVIIAELVLTVPFAVWMLRGFFLDIPPELEEAAIMDGCSKMQALRFVLLPVVRPGIIAAAVMSWIFSWNEYLLPLVLITGDEKKTIPLGIAGFMTENYIQWGPLLASGVVSTLPVLVLYVFLQRYLIEGLTAGAVKG